MCEDAPCSKVCKKGDPARALRAMRFDNIRVAQHWLADCSEEDLNNAEKACIHYDRPVRTSVGSFVQRVPSTSQNVLVKNSAYPSPSHAVFFLHR